MTRTSTLVTVENDNNPALVSQNEISARLAEYADAAEGAFATATEKARASDSRIWAQWCSDNAVAIVPADPRAVVQFIGQMAETRKPATVRRYLQTINQLHKAAELDPPSKGRLVSLALRRMDRANGTAQQQAQPVTIDTVRAILASIDAETANIDLTKKSGQRRSRVCNRDRALIALAYFTGLRRSEIVALDLADIDLTDADGTGAGTVAIRKSKTDQTGEGTMRGISGEVVAILRGYIETAGIASGPLFISANGNRLSGIDVARVLKARCAALGIDPATVSGHSTRRGAAVDRYRAGDSTAQIAKDLAWKGEDTVRRYGRDIDVRRSAARAAEQLGSLIG